MLRRSGSCIEPPISCSKLIPPKFGRAYSGSLNGLRRAKHPHSVALQRRRHRAEVRRLEPVWHLARSANRNTVLLEELLEGGRDVHEEQTPLGVTGVAEGVRDIRVD